MSRRLYLVAYDVCDPKRLARVYRYLNAYKVDGQKSVFEIWITKSELMHIHQDLTTLMNEDEDRLHILVLDPRQKPKCLGLATHFEEKFFHIY